MNTHNTIILNFIERMVKDGYSKSRISRIKGLMNKLLNYMISNNYNEINDIVFSNFIKDTYDFDYYNPINNNQLDKIKYLKNLLEFKNTDNYLKCHQKQKVIVNRFVDIYNKYEIYLNTTEIKSITKKCKLNKIKLFLNSLDKISNINQLEKNHCYNFINNLDYSLRYKEELTYELRRFINWLFDNKFIHFDGYSTFPRIINQSRTNILSYYSNSEVEQVLNIVDINTSVGKRDYLILSLLIYYGLRISDIIELKLSDINWSLNTISIIQQKSDLILTLPLIEKVKYSLLDYIKNARPNIDNDYIFITEYAPIGRYQSKSFHTMITKYMDKVGINYNNKHHGTHSLRHSLASNMLKNNISLSTISSILGHSTIKTTEQYITIDNKNLKELSLEVNINV